MAETRRFSSPQHEWLAYLTHDLAVPLFGIGRAIETLELLAYTKRRLTKSELIAIGEKIRSELTEAQAVIGGVSNHLLLDDAGFQPARLSLRDILMRVLPKFRDEAEEDKDIDLRYDRTLPDAYIHGDADLLVAVFRNILRNAIE